MANMLLNVTCLILLLVSGFVKKTSETENFILPIVVDDVSGTGCKDGAATCVLQQFEASGNENVGTCSDNPCKDPGSWCKNVEELYDCSCKPGFCSLTSNPQICEVCLQFGGKLYVKNNVQKARSKQSQIQSFLLSAYESSIGFIYVQVAENSANGVWSYSLFYNNNNGVNESYISSWFSSYLSEEQKCNLTVQFCNVTLPDNQSMELDTTSSIAKAGGAEEVVCEDFLDYCDSTSTACSSGEGFTSCKCKDGYVQTFGNDRTCAKKICSSNSDCNSPFGWCEPEINNNIGECKCIVGFDGDHCKNPWLFVFLIVTCILTAAIILSIFAIWHKTKSKKSQISPAIPLSTNLSATSRNHSSISLVGNATEA